MFTADMVEKEKKEIVIKGVNADMLEKLIDYSYTRTLRITTDNIWNLLPAASMLAFHDIENACDEFLKSVLFENPGECLAVCSFVKNYNLMELAEKSISIAIDLFADVTKTDAFLNLSFEMLENILKGKKRIALNEEAIFKAIMKWIQHDETQRSKFIPSIMERMSLKAMSLPVGAFHLLQN